MLSDQPTRITVLVPTRDRPDSLQITLKRLLETDRTHIDAHVVIINNGHHGSLDSVVESAQGVLPIHVLEEPHAGKAYALNRALADAELFEIVVVIDDDISVDPGWFQGIRGACMRWPEHGFFGGCTEIEWPLGQLPTWGHSPSLRGWAFSVNTPINEREVRPNRWVSGNHFWFRPAFLPEDFRFDVSRTDRYIEMCEPKMMFDLAEMGHGGVLTPDAKATHRVQPELLCKDVLYRRAARVGRGNAEARTVPYRELIPQSKQLRKHPLLGRAYCCLESIRWALIYLAARWVIPGDRGFLMRLEAIMQLNTWTEYLRVSTHMDVYRIGRRG